MTEHNDAISGASADFIPLAFRRLERLPPRDYMSGIIGLWAFS